MNDETRAPDASRRRHEVHGGRLARAAAAELTPLSGVDYGDQFTLACPDATRWTAEMWARAMFGDAPDRAERFIWQGLLHLRLARRATPQSIAGWPVVDRSACKVRLETRSWLLTGNLIVSTAADSVSLGTFLRYDRRLAAAVWLPLSAVHRRLAPGLLGDARDRLVPRG